MDSPAQTKTLAGPIITIIGGAAAILGSLLSWAKVSIASPLLKSLSMKVTGTSATEGKITIACGIVLLIGGILILLGGTQSLRRGMAIAAVVAGLVVLGVTTYDIATKDRQFNSAFREGVRSTPAGAALSDAQIDALRSRFGVTFSLEFGIILALVGGVIGGIGGVVALAAKEPEAAGLTSFSAAEVPVAPPAPPPPPAEAGQSSAPPSEPVQEPPAEPASAPPAEPRSWEPPPASETTSPDPDRDQGP
jgi:hypothetical protein